MSPIASKLLSMAYEHYKNTSDRAFSYQCKNGDDLFFSTEAAKQLYEDGYIEQVSNFVFEDSLSPFLGPITFYITTKGIEYVCTQREL